MNYNILKLYKLETKTNFIFKKIQEQALCYIVINKKV